MPLRVYRSCCCIRSEDKITAKNLSSSRTSYLQPRVLAMSIRDLLILNLTLQVFDGLFSYQVFSLGAAGYRGPCITRANRIRATRGFPILVASLTHREDKGIFLLCDYFARRKNE